MSPSWLITDIISSSTVATSFSYSLRWVKVLGWFLKILLWLLSCARNLTVLTFWHLLPAQIFDFDKKDPVNRSKRDIEKILYLFWRVGIGASSFGCLNWLNLGWIWGSKYLVLLFSSPSISSMVMETDWTGATTIGANYASGSGSKWPKCRYSSSSATEDIRVVDAVASLSLAHFSMCLKTRSLLPLYPHWQK